MERFNEMFKNSNIGGLVRVFPWLKHIIPDYIGYTNMKNVQEAVQEMVEESYQKHLETFDSENVRDFTDAYIKHQLGEMLNCCGLCRIVSMLKTLIASRSISKLMNPVSLKHLPFRF